MSEDVLRLRNMRFYGYHGLLPEEEALGQLFEVDVEIIRDLSAAGKTDDPAATVDYVVVYGLVEEAVTQERCRLVEGLAERIAERVGRACAPVEVLVRVRKPHPPVPAHFDGLEVEIRRNHG